MMIYENRDEFRHRLFNTVILIDGLPVYIADIVGTPSKPVLVTFDLPLGAGQQDRKEVPADHPAICVTPFPIGFVNLKEEAAYYWRLPVRNQLQGVWNGSLEGKYAFNRLKAPPNFTRLIYVKEFVQCIAGAYPTLEKVIADIRSDDENKPKALAFHRKFATLFDEDAGLFMLNYRGNLVGHSHDGAKWQLGPNYKYLKEVAKEAKLNVA